MSHYNIKYLYTRTSKNMRVMRQRHVKNCNDFVSPRVVQGIGKDGKQDNFQKCFVVYRL